MSYTNRNQIPEKYKWDLSDIFPTEEAWEQAFDQMSAKVEINLQFKGRLSDDAVLLECLKLNDQLDVEQGKLYCYAYMRYNEDSQNSAAQQRYAKIYGLLTKFGAASSFLTPEISAFSNEKLQGLIANPLFADYDVMFGKILEGKDHVLSEAEEKL